MSVNVLEFNEIAGEINTLRNTTLPNAKTTTAVTANAAGTACGGALSVSVAAKQCNYGVRLTCDLQTRPWDCQSWASIPTIVALDGFKVCDASGSEAANQMRCGATCSWVVPPGVTTARFQAWGAGAGSHNMCCCGGGMWGGSGAYASVILPVTPGATYTICSGCAYCCMMRSEGPTGGAGSPSYVTGPGLCNFCADGGDPSPWCWLQRATSRSDGYCVIMNAQNYYNKVSYKGTYYGWCMCGGGGFCWSNSCSGRDAIPFTTSCRTWYGCVHAPTKGCHFVIGAPGMFNSANMGSGYDGDRKAENYDGAYTEYCLQLTHPPIVNLTCDVCSWGICAGATCAGCFGKIQCGVFPYPSRGGRATYVGGGCDNCGGSYGGMGMVCVQWNKE
jgi:hypothetical protein